MRGLLPLLRAPLPRDYREVVPHWVTKVSPFSVTPVTLTAREPRNTAVFPRCVDSLACACGMLGAFG